MYQLLNYNHVIKTFDIVTEREATNGMTTWLSNRQSVRERAGMAALFSKFNLLDFQPFVNITHGLGLNDCFWVKDEADDLDFENVNLYDNDFNDIISQVAFTGSGEFLPGLSPEFTTHGGLVKRWLRDRERNIFLLKGGDYEPYAEYVASELCKQLGLENYVWYKCISYEDADVSLCPLFTTKRLGFRPASKYLKSYDFSEIKNSFGEYKSFWDMMLLDYLILNTDRHLNNFGFIVNNDTDDIVDMAPIFDNGNSLGATRKPVGDITDYINTRLPAIGGSFWNNIKMDKERFLCASMFNINGNDFINQACKIIRYQANNALENMKG